MDLSALFHQAQGGDEAAFTELVKAYRNLAYGYALSLVSDPGLAQDVAQEAFITAYYRLSTIRKPGAFAGWLRTVIHRLCGRALSRGRREASLDEAVGLACRREGPEDSLAKREVTEVLEATVQALPQQQREVVLLYYLEERSQKDVAAFLDIPPSTVNNRLHAARHEAFSLRELLAIEPAFPPDVQGPLQTGWLVTEQATDPSFAETTDLLDARIYASRLISCRGLLPAVDPLRSSSYLLDPAIMDGNLGGIPEEAFLFAGDLEDVRNKANSLDS